MKSNLHKIIVITVALALMFFAVSCGNSNDTSQDKTDAKETKTDAKEPKIAKEPKMIDRTKKLHINSERIDTKELVTDTRRPVTDTKELVTDTRRPITDAKDPIIVKIAAPKIFPALTFARVIKNGGFSKDIKVEFKVLNKPTDIPPIAKKESADLLFMPLNLASVLYNNGMNYQAYKILEMDLLRVVSTDPGIRSLSDLKGKEVHVFGKGATPDVLLNFMLEQNKINPQEDVKLAYKEAPQLAQLLIANKIHTAILPEPLATKCTIKNERAKIVTSYGKEISAILGFEFNITQASLMINKTFAKNNPDLVKKISALYDDEVEKLRANPLLFGELAKEQSIFGNPSLIKKIMPEVGPVIKSAYDVRHPVEEYFKILYKMNPKTVGGNIPKDDFYYIEK